MSLVAYRLQHGRHLVMEFVPLRAQHKRLSANTYMLILTAGVDT